MTRIDFYSPVYDPFKTLQQALKKAAQIPKRVIVWTRDAAAAQQLDQQLWVWDATSFLPHCLVGSATAADTALVIGHPAVPEGEALPHYEIMINLSDTQPAIVPRFERVLEFIQPGQDSRLRGRERYRFYQSCGYTVSHHVLASA